MQLGLWYDDIDREEAPMRGLKLNEENVAVYRRRLEKLTAESKPQWGTLDATALMAHLTRSFEISLGQHPVKDASNMLTRSWIFHKVMIEWLPWPKGQIKSPDYFTPAPKEDFETERARLFAKMEEFVTYAQKRPMRVGVSPIFGPMPLKYWRKLHGIHMEHHCRQFGI